MSDFKTKIIQGKTALGIELGSTRIKAVLIDESYQPIASGSHEWENQLIDGVWTYAMEDVWSGLRACYADLKKDVLQKHDVKLTSVGAIGISGMMHGYLAFDKNDQLLTPFRTWRNTMTADASHDLTELFHFNVPQRWSISHLYQAILNKEAHVSEISHLTTLAGYVHWQLTGEKLMGVGEASGMFPIDNATCNFDATMISALEEKLSPLGFDWTVSDILPKVLKAGDSAGVLTPEGAKLLDASGELASGIPLCPPEGDAGTGMVATNAVRPRTGNVSAGTSVFGMVVMDKTLSKVYPEIDIVTTPTGEPVAMVHCNNCTTELNAWVGLFGEFAKATGMEVSTNQLFSTLYRKALEADPSVEGMLAYNFHSGEHIVGFEEGRPAFVRTPNANFNLANFMRTHLYASLSVLKYGMDILLKQENVGLDMIFGHGGLFKTKGVGQSILAAAIHAPVYVMETAGEGGAWGVALLAEFCRSHRDGELLADFLSDRVFCGRTGEPILPDPKDEAGFDNYLERYMAALPIERAAIDTLK